MKNLEKIADFLKSNGWELWDKDEYLHFAKKDSVGIDVNEKEIVFIDDSGDYAHIVSDYYALVGFIIVHRIINPTTPA